MKTRVHYYRIDTSTTKGQTEYAALLARIAANHPEARGKWMHAAATSPSTAGNDSPRTIAVEIETAFLFSNQWNTAPTDDSQSGMRVFDHYEEISYYYGRECAPHIKVGHWTEITDEMAAARHNTLKCGYCGHHYGPLHGAPPADGFCRACLDSPYLKAEELHLLRLRPITEEDNSRAPLSYSERDAIMPEYVSRQTSGADSRAVAKRAKQREKIERDLTLATRERDGMLWLLDRGMDLENWIYYSHTDTFACGWRDKGVSPEVASAVLEIVSEFPYRYEVRQSDGTKYTNAAD